MNIPKQKNSFYLKNVFIASLLIPVCNQDVTVNKPWGGRRHCSMTVEEEKEFLNKWENIATGGGVLTVPPKNLSDFDAQRIVKNISDDKKSRELLNMLWRHFGKSGTRQDVGKSFPAIRRQGTLRLKNSTIDAKDF
jgi:hypothetical protein